MIWAWLWNVHENFPEMSSGVSHFLLYKATHLQFLPPRLDRVAPANFTYLVHYILFQNRVLVSTCLIGIEIFHAVQFKIIVRLLIAIIEPISVVSIE
jgi:hypothetical protein